MENQLTVSPAEFGIEQSKATELVGNLPQIQEERNILESMYNEIINLDIEDPDTSKKARELRIKIKENRTKGIEVWHKTTKEYFLKGGQFVDAIKRKEIAVNQRMEEGLEQIETHFETKEAARKKALSDDRNAKLLPYSEFVPFGINFGEISEEEFLKVFNGAKLQHAAKIDAEIKAEKDRIKAQKAEEKRLAEEKRIESEKFEAQRLENERLKQEAEAREKAAEIERKKQAEILAKQQAESEAKLQAEREAREKAAEIERKKQAEILAKQQAESEAKLQAEREAREKAEAEIERKKQAEILAEKTRLAAEEKARRESEKLAKAPIKKQLSSWMHEFTAEIPETLKNNDTANNIISKFWAFKSWAEKEIENL